jgi:2-polyprenyl-3-methyl-5-hydroxy-6-metoxy-1,4-benzoquinol methylase
MDIQGPESLMRMMQGVQVSGIFKAAVDLGVYTKMAEGAVTVPAMAGAIGCPERSTRILLDAMTTLGLLTKAGASYALTPATEQFLVRGKPTYMGDLVNLFGSPTSWGGAQKLADAVRNDGTVMPEHSETPRYAFWEMFARSTAALAVPAANALHGVLAEWRAARPKIRVLDIAAGSGLYGFTLAKDPKVHLTALDWPNVLVETREWAKRMGVDVSRVGYIEGNFFEVDFQGPYDLILLSNIFHHFDAPTCESLMKKAAGAVAPGGRLVVNDYMYDPELKNPMGALFAVTMLVASRKGQTHSVADYTRWFEAAGLRSSGVHPSGPTSTLLFADK